MVRGPMPATRRPKRRLRALLLGIGGGLVAAEVLLQIAALVLAGSASATGAGAATILCCGDSFTFGLGSSAPAHAYPAQLEAILREGGKTDIVVANAGWPAQTSREVLANLAKDLAARSPRLVYVLIGINDVGWAPARLTAAEESAGGAGQGWRFELRLPRLFHTFTQWLGGGPSYSRHGREGVPFLGVWHREDLELAFERGGQLRLGTAVCAWRMEGERLFVRSGLDVEVPVAWHLDDARLEITLPGTPVPLQFTRGGAPRRAPLQASRDALGAGNPDAARTAIVPLLHDPVLGGEALRLWFAASAELGDEEAVTAKVRELEAAAAGGERAACDAWLAALLIVGRVDEALRQEERLFHAGVDHAPLAGMLLDLSLLPARHRLVHERIAALLGAGEVLPRLRPWLLRWHALSLRDREPRRALAAIVEAEILEPHAPFSSVTLRHPAFDRALLDEVLGALAASAEAGDRVRALWGEGATNTSAVAATMRDHLVRVAARCAASGAQCVVLGYPFLERTVDRVLVELARDDGVATLALAPVFDAALRTRRWDELFVIDGHCGDAGYRLMAEAVAEDAARRLGGK